jgi:hypothetical protein
MDQHLFTLTSMSNLIAAIRPLYVFIDNVLKLQSARNYIKIQKTVSRVFPGGHL